MSGIREVPKQPNERMQRALTEKAWRRYTELLAAREARNAAALTWWRAVQPRPMAGPR